MMMLMMAMDFGNISRLDKNLLSHFGMTISHRDEALEMRVEDIASSYIGILEEEEI